MKIWLRVVLVGIVLTALSLGGLVTWSAGQQRKLAENQARDFAHSVHQMTLAGLTGMMITGTIALREVFLDQIKSSNHIDALKVVRGEALIKQYGAGHASERASTDAEREVLASGKPHFAIVPGADGEERLHAVLPALALTDYLGKNCLGCHQVPAGTVLGAVSMEVSLAAARKTTRAFTQQAVLASAAILVPIALLLWWLVSRVVERPLIGMTTGLRDLAAGNADDLKPLPTRGDDEVAQAIGAFNTVVGKVRALLDEQRLMQVVFENSLEGIAVTDAKVRFKMVNQAFVETTGYTLAEVEGKTPQILKSGRQDESFYKEFWRSLSENGSWRGEIWNRRKNGVVYPEWLNVSAVRNSRGEVENYVAIFADITERKQREESIMFQAFHDALTGLPNRTLFTDRLEQALAKARRAKTKRPAVMFLDLDKFKEINDTYGHDAGDELLKAVANRLKACVRGSDTVARLGGDEFTVLLPDAETLDEARIVGEKILEQMRQPVDLGPVSRVITTSIGVAQFQTHATDAVSLTKFADTAMYHVKGTGRAGMCIYSDELAGQSNRAEAMQEDLRGAITGARLRVELAPRHDAGSGEVSALMARLWWIDAQGGLRDIDEVFDAAVEADLKRAVFAFYLDEALRAAMADGRPLPLHVFLVDAVLSNRDLATTLREALQHFPDWPGSLCLCVGEATLDADFAALAALMATLDDLFVRLVVNDYGGSQSHLDALSKVPLAGLCIPEKLAKASAMGDARAVQRVRMIQDMAKLLGTRSLSNRPPAVGPG